jgi:hypothetical protein
MKRITRSLWSRLRDLEAWMPRTNVPPKAFMPDWLMHEYEKEGVRFDSSGQPDWDSLCAVFSGASRSNHFDKQDSEQPEESRLDVDGSATR